MTLTEYLKDKLLLILLHTVCMLCVSGFLLITGYSLDCLILILICWVLVVAVVWFFDFWKKRAYFAEMEKILERLDERYLLGELMPERAALTDRIYRDMIRKSNKSVIEKLRAIDKERKEYREFIESWVHEIKAPITAVELLCENHKEELTRSIWLENRRILNSVEMALYYARADEVYKDYIIRKTDLTEVVSGVLAGNKYYLIQNGVQAEVDCRDTVYTDEKWIAFIVNQLILNSVKYKNGASEKLTIYTEKYEREVHLIVKDDGVGIKESELPRIFDKGFTGSNGRKNEHSTGMGLYLCHNLCRKLGIELSARSWENEGTEMILKFPIGNYHMRENE